MRIAFMTSGTIKSSISYRPLALAREFVKRGHEVYVFAPRFDKYSKFIDQKITEIDGVKIVRPLQIKTFSFELGLIPYILSSLIHLHRINPDIAHIYKPNPVTLSCLITQLIRKTKVIFDTDDIDSEVMKVERNSWLKVKLVQLSEKFALNRSNAIIVGSRYLFNLYKPKYKNKIVSYIPNGADFDTTQKLNTSNISSNKVIFVGALNRINILEPLFYAVKELDKQSIQMHTIIMGDGKYMSYFKSLVKKLNINDKISFLGWVPQQKLYKHIHVGDIGYSYMPNELTIKACSSMKVFQYMQYGAIPLVSNVGDFPTYTFKGKAGYIAKHSDIKSLANTLKIALSNKNERKNKITYAVKHAEKKYKWSVLADKTEKIYKKIV